MSYDGTDDLVYNPFAEEDDENGPGSSQGHGYYGSAFFPRLNSSRPTLRKRRSSLTDKSGTHPNGGRRRHLRSRTEIQVVPPNSAGLHPLKSALAATVGAVLTDTGITRPHLSRIVNEGSLVDVPSADDASTSSKSPVSVDEEKDVIVHQITSKDSLAGVSLKYGISMANLRRANQLWTSDSIHRRDVLYIPVDQASRAREYIPEPKLISLTPDPTEETTNTFEAAYTSTSPVGGDNSETNPSSSTVPVLRVPARQLSYFPPSSNKNSDVILNGQSATNSPYLQPAGTPKFSPTSSRHSPSTASHSLTSILTALPITASTRDELITRLSLDSVSSSFSERSRANSDEEDGHELNEVAQHRRHSRRLNGAGEDGMDDASLPTPKASHRPPQSQLFNHIAPRVTLSSSVPKSSHARSLSSGSGAPPQFYVSQAQETYVRTSQLEPSPAMQLPNFRSSTVGRSAGRAGKGLPENLGMERTSSSNSTLSSKSMSSSKSSKADDGNDINFGLVLQRMQINESR